MSKVYTIEPHIFTVHRKIYVLKPSLNDSEKMIIMVISKTPEWATGLLGFTLGLIWNLKPISGVIGAIIGFLLPVLLRMLFFKHYQHGVVHPTHHYRSPGNMTYYTLIPTEFFATLETIKANASRGAISKQDIDFYYKMSYQYSRTGELYPMPHRVREQLWNTALGGNQYITPSFDVDYDATRPLYFITGEKK